MISGQREKRHQALLLSQRAMQQSGALSPLWNSPRNFLSGSSCILYCSKHSIQVERAIMTDTVDEECRCSVHSTLYTTEDVFSYVLNNGRVAKILFESGQVKIEINRILYEMNVIGPILTLEHLAIPLPTLPFPPH